MAIPNYLMPTYMGAMDQANYFAGLDAIAGPTYEPGNAFEGIDTGLGPMELGMTNNPMQNQLAALQAKIREGASKIEFEFAGRQKGSSQASTPESYGKEEREMMRQLAALNDIKTSTHATFSVSGLAGFNPQQGGFNKQVQHQTVHEVERAIDFAKDATTGGAIVVHTGEWNRPIAHHYKDEGFELYQGQEEEEPLYMVEPKTGQVISVFPGQQTVAPLWHTAASYSEVYGKNLVGEGEDVHGNKVEIRPEDFVDMFGRKINPRDTKELFKRVPILNEDGTGFETETIEWNSKDGMKGIKERAKEYEKTYGVEMPPEKFFAQLQLENQILQAKGQATFYFQRYTPEAEEMKVVQEAIEYYKQLDKNLSDDEKWRLVTQQRPLGDLGPPQNVNILDHLEKRRKQLELSLLHTHEATAAADARVQELQNRLDNMKTVEEYGITQTADALSNLALRAMEATRVGKEMRKGTDERFDDLYIAPENWHPSQYGSHPKELLKIVQEGRKAFVDKLLERKQAANQEEAERLAKAHIKTTLDIGHFNMWRNMYAHKEGESEEQFQKRFNTWLEENLEEFHKEEAIGHLHLTDNFGFNDEHLSLGQGNTPVKEFVKFMQDRGHTDFIIEPGSFNPMNIMQDAWSYLGAVNWRQRHFGPAFRSTHMAHAGLYASPNYIVGAYVPSNEWTLWSGVQLE